MSHNISKIRLILLPFAWIFGGISRLRRWLYQKGVCKSYTPAIPTICVGNIAIGGTGKTPHAAFLLQHLEKEHHIAMLSRGYGRQTSGYILANATPKEKLSAKLIGDEPLLFCQRCPDLPLAVDENRCEGVQKLLSYAPDTDVIIMDDAYQYLALTPTLRMILTEYEYPYFKDFPMPAGRLREFPSAVSEADLVIVTKTEVPNSSINREWWRKKLKLRADQPLFFTHYSYNQPEPVTAIAKQLTDLESRNVILMTGIARPQPLVEHLKKTYTIQKHFQFMDHHRYTSDEIMQIKKQFFQDNSEKFVLFTTEKDWMRLRSPELEKIIHLLPVFIIPIQIEFLTEEEHFSFINIIEDHVRKKS